MDIVPDRKRIAQLLRMLGSSGGEKRNTFAALERTIKSGGQTWTDVGDDYERAYTEAEMQQYAEAMRAEGVEAGIKIGLARASNGGGNGHITLPPPAQMADLCRRHRDALESKHYEFVDKAPARVQARRPLSPKEEGYLASLYIQLHRRGKV